ncbi:MAG: hypothetical protein ACM3PF_06190 [Bacteroidota bacterium]
MRSSSPCIPLLCAAAILLVGVFTPTGRASAQCLYLDVNGDRHGDAADVLGPGTTDVDVWLDTSHNADASTAVCASGEPLDVCSYTFIVEWEPGKGGGSLSYGPWSDNMGFTVNAGGMQKGRMFWIGRAAPYYLAPGLYKIGSLAVKVTGTPILRFLSSTEYDKTAITSFGSQCDGRDFDNTIKLGQEFVDAKGTSSEDDTPRNAWADIRDLYR